jgi:hypothetical protein
VVYISSLRISCKELSSDNIGLSLDGELKLSKLATALLAHFA